MHVQQQSLNVCNTDIIGNHHDTSYKIKIYKDQIYRSQVNWLVRITDYLSITFGWNCFQNYYSYSKTMFLVLDQVYYWGFRSNTHNNYNYIIKTKWDYLNKKLVTTEEEAPSKLVLGLW
jgi:hypothetical protein